jgi:hypothetical protein
LDEEIQQGGASGHDSYEDARTTGELVRFKIKEKWKVMKHDGWTVGEVAVYPPVPTGTPPPGSDLLAASLVPTASMATFQGNPAEKRKMEIIEHGEGVEPPAKRQA